MKLKQNPYNRNRNKPKPHSDYVASIIAKYYDRLKNELIDCEGGNFLSMTFQDIFQETVLSVIQDKKAFTMSPEKILEYFKYKHKMIRFQVIQDAKLIKKAHYSRIKETKQD